MSIMYGYILLVTFVGSVMDIRRKSIPVWYLCVAAVGIIPIAVWKPDLPLSARLFGGAAGLLFFGIALVSHEAVGKGDAAIIGIVGTALGFSSLCVILCISFLILAIFSLGYIVIRRVGRKARVPFYPFLGAGELLLMLLISCREVMK